MSLSVPPYVYAKTLSYSLAQGDVILAKGDLLSVVKKYYPEIRTHEAGGTSHLYLMVLSQTCDLVKAKKRTPKVDHVLLCPIRSFSQYVAKEIDEKLREILDIKRLKDRRIIIKSRHNALHEKITRLVNNSESKLYFFLPKKKPFQENMVAMLPISFPLRIDKYDLLLDNRVLSLKPEFQAKIGYIISQLYGRIATSDLSDHGWGDAELVDYVDALLRSIGVVSVPDKSFVKYISDKFDEKNEDVPGHLDELVAQQNAILKDQALQDKKRVLTKNFKDGLFDFFKDQDKVSKLGHLSDVDLRKTISSLVETF